MNCGRLPELPAGEAKRGGISGVYPLFYDPEAQRIGTGVNADGSADLIDGDLIDPVSLFF